MISVADSDNLQNLLAGLNIDISSGLNNDKKVEKLVLQLGELSSRYSDLASRYLKLVNARSLESTKGFFADNVQTINPQNGILEKSLLNILSVLYLLI